jgi:hypothetical protein
MQTRKAEEVTELASLDDIKKDLVFQLGSIDDLDWDYFLETAVRAKLQADHEGINKPEFDQKQSVLEVVSGLDEDGIKKAVTDSMEYRWNDWVGDTHSLPNDIELSNSKTTASFSPGQWADQVATDIASFLDKSA